MVNWFVLKSPRSHSREHNSSINDAGKTGYWFAEGWIWTLLYPHTTHVITRQSQGLNVGCEAGKLLGKAQWTLHDFGLGPQSTGSRSKIDKWGCAKLNKLCRLRKATKRKETVHGVREKNCEPLFTKGWVLKIHKELKHLKQVKLGKEPEQTFLMMRQWARPPWLSL
jgi:hypothetical protein